MNKIEIRIKFGMFKNTNISEREETNLIISKCLSQTFRSKSAPQLMSVAIINIALNTF